MYLPNFLARCFLSGAQDKESVQTRVHSLLGRKWRWIGPLSGRYIAHFLDRPQPRHREVVRFLAADEGLRAARERYGSEIQLAHLIGEHPIMQPVNAAETWGVPRLETEVELAIWLGIATEELEWFADLKHLAREGPLGHYNYQIFRKKHGGLRLIEAPKTRLKAIQRQVLAGILSKVPAHPHVHGFVRQRSILSFASPHVAQAEVLKMDLRDFFPSFSRARVQALFRTAGYPERVADLLGGLCTNIVPKRALGTQQDFSRDELLHARNLYSQPHLPQGAATSPALANICFYRVDCRLSGLARSVGANYSRYADDLAFSGGVDFARVAERFSLHVAVIVAGEGFAIHHRKTRIMRRGVRQRLTGLVVNKKVNVSRREYDVLKATLTNCARLGPASQNRADHPAFREHLEGRISFVASVHEGKGAKLRAIFDRIQW